jgi:hypothetical protein
MKTQGGGETSKKVLLKYIKKYIFITLTCQKHNIQKYFFFIANCQLRKRHILELSPITHGHDEFV